jgi:hypothetical protein
MQKSKLGNKIVCRNNIKLKVPILTEGVLACNTDYSRMDIMALMFINLWDIHWCAVMTHRNTRPRVPRISQGADQPYLCLPRDFHSLVTISNQHQPKGRPRAMCGCVCVWRGGAHLVLWNCYSNHHPRHLLVRLVTKAFQAEPFTAEFCVTGWCFTFSAEGDFYQLISLLMRWRICCIWRLTRRGTSCPRCRGSAETVGTKFESGGCGYFWG